MCHNLWWLFGCLAWRLIIEEPALRLPLDAKVCDYVEWIYLLALLEHIGFGPGLQTWVWLLYQRLMARVRLHGAQLEEFELGWSTQQGCLLSLLPFVVAMEALATWSCKSATTSDRGSVGSSFSTRVALREVTALDPSCPRRANLPPAILKPDKRPPSLTDLQAEDGQMSYHLDEVYNLAQEFLFRQHQRVKSNGGPQISCYQKFGRCNFKICIGNKEHKNKAMLGMCVRVCTTNRV
ncbi:hypothetical protein NDU88_001483 [Pleurodeles waltl]|uniref:Uncharacterized protein n=1 Tax=Pleurodeles waltl TaxID=8319 RepID=A0AAV7MSW0_PLEWA|nr:hypothetical protein NDU88_001483 [Pleurodeles waltl]